MGDVQRHNLREIERLNQRGGRMLSLVDLLEADTVDLPLAADLALTAARGGSFLTAAGPGGVGKTTLMAAMLAFLPPDVRIVTIADPSDLARPASGRECLVVHEIGSGSWYGYLWGPAVVDYVGLIDPPTRCIAGNLHADTCDEATRQLTGSPLGVSADALSRIDLMAFMSASGGRRRVTAVWQQRDGAHEQTWRCDPDADGFELLAAPADSEAERFEEFLARARRDECRLIEDLRARATAELFD